MSIHRRETPSGVRYDVRWLDGTRHRSKTFRRANDAKAFEADLVRRKALGPVVTSLSGSMTVSDACDAWLAEGKQVWSLRTYAKRDGQATRNIKPLFLGVKVRDVDSVRVKTFRSDMLAKGATDKLANEVMKTLSAFFGWAVDGGVVGANPVSAVKPLRTMPTRRRIPSDDEIEAVSAALPDDTDRAILWILAGTGMRPAELCGLLWGDVQNGILHIDRSIQRDTVVPPKNNKGRTTQIGPECRRGLALLPPGKPFHYVVTGTDMPLGWDRWANGRFRPAAKNAGAYFTPYVLRHRRASRLLEAGVPPAQVAAELGHTIAVLYDRYAHLLHQVSLSDI